MPSYAETPQTLYAISKCGDCFFIVVTIWIIAFIILWIKEKHRS